MLQILLHFLSVIVLKYKSVRKSECEYGACIYKLDFL